jgi:hypothetical protein
MSQKPTNPDDIKEQEAWIQSIRNVYIAESNAETIQRYGSANKEHLVAYSGVDRETGTTLKRSLQSIAESKVHPDHIYANIKQQAGFSAEVKEVARENAERIINRDKSRVVRTDDIGRVNDPLYDHIEIDSTGNIIPNSGSQMKFVGKNSKEIVDKLVSPRFEKYRATNTPIEVPSDAYDEIKRTIQEEITVRQEQVSTLSKQGKYDLAEENQKKIQQYKKIEKNLRKSHVSNQEAWEARIHPELSTAKDIVGIGHRAGME